MQDINYIISILKTYYNPFYYKNITQQLLLEKVTIFFSPKSWLHLQAHQVGRSLDKHWGTSQKIQIRFGNRFDHRSCRRKQKEFRLQQSERQKSKRSNPHFSKKHFWRIRPRSLDRLPPLFSRLRSASFDLWAHSHR